MVEYSGPLAGAGTVRSTGPELEGGGQEWVEPKMAQAGVVWREIPLTTISTSWGVASVRQALTSLVTGLFDWPAQLWDSIIGDDRVQATIGSRTGGLLGRPVKFEASDLDADHQVFDAWQQAWPTIAAEPIMSELQRWTIGMGFGIAQIMWDTTQPVWVPHVRPWHPRYSYYHWMMRRYIAITMDGQVPVIPGDGKWILHAPHGDYRGWMRGSVRAIAQPWLVRQFALRDWARWSERHGMPIYLAKIPAAGDPVAADAFAKSLATLGQESVVKLPQGVEAQFSYDMDLLEAKDPGWQGFQQLINQCDMSIVLTLMYQNLTTEMKEGSFAAARVHADIRQSALEADARALSHTIYQQLARPFAAYNFGDPNLAPRTDWDVTPVEDSLAQANTLDRVADAILKMGKGGKGIKHLGELFERFNIPLTDKDIEEIAPIASGGLGQ